MESCFIGDDCEFVDLLLFMSAAQCCGDFILKFNATLRTDLAYELRDKNLYFESTENFNASKGIWIIIDANEKIIPNCNEVIENNCSELAHHKERGF